MTWTDRLGYPLGVSISWLDPIPIVALLLRPFSSLLPPAFQYLGLYLCAAFILQAVFSLRLAARLFPGNLVYSLATTVFLVASPVVTMRARATSR